MAQLDQQAPDARAAPAGIDLLDAEHPLVQVHLGARDGAVVLQATGELDQSCVAVLEAALDEAIETVAAPTPLVVDLTRLDFLGSCGLAALVKVHEECERRGTPLRVATEAPVVHKVVHGTDLDGVLPLYTSVDTAIAGH